MRTGFCNRLNPADSHERCRPIAGEACECDCHQRFGVIWVDWVGEPHTQGDFRDQHDVDLMLDLMIRLDMIPPSADSGVEVVPYRQGEEWLA